MSGKRALVVGASGQVGRQLVAALGRGRCVTTGRSGRFPGDIQLDLEKVGDRRELAALALREAMVDSVYCPAGMTNVERCEAEADLALRINCVGPAVLAEACARLDLPFVYFSTEYIFDGAAGPYCEADRAKPLSAYGQSKWRGEEEILKVHPHALILRTTVVYGPDPGGRNFLCSLRQALRDGRPFPVAADQISTPTYNRDLAHAAVSLMEAGAAGVFHVCGPERVSRLEFARRAAELMGLDPSPIRGVPTSALQQRASRPLNAGLSTQKLKLHFPLVRMRSLEQSIPECMDGADSQ
jgi:dTDP-4-dehydrorhamnose reductase